MAKTYIITHEISDYAREEIIRRSDRFKRFFINLLTEGIEEESDKEYVRQFNGEGAGNPIGFIDIINIE